MAMMAMAQKPMNHAEVRASVNLWPRSVCAPKRAMAGAAVIIVARVISSTHTVSLRRSDIIDPNTAVKLADCRRAI